MLLALKMQVLKIKYRELELGVPKIYADSTGPEEAILKWSGQGVARHYEILSSCCVNARGSGSMLPQENFLNCML